MTSAGLPFTAAEQVSVRKLEIVNRTVGRVGSVPVRWEPPRALLGWQEKFDRSICQLHDFCDCDGPPRTLTNVVLVMFLIGYGQAL